MKGPTIVMLENVARMWAWRGAYAELPGRGPGVPAARLSREKVA